METETTSKEERLVAIRADIARLRAEEAEIKASLNINDALGQLTLTEACLKVLENAKPYSLRNSEVETLLVSRGYQSTAKNPRSSIKITLRRLAKEGRCQVQTEAGRIWHTYSAKA